MGNIPGGLADIDAAWVTSVLRQRGATDVEVSEAPATVIGAGEGFAGELARIEPVYRRGVGPASFIVKVPTPVVENRSGSELLNVYERELRVYEQLLPELDVPHPALVHGAIEDNPVDMERQLAWLPRIDRLPVPMLRLLGRALARPGREIDRASVLALEDLAPATVGDQVVGATKAEAAAVLDVAARLHAGTWGRRRPAPTVWLSPGDIAVRLFHATFLDVRKGFLARGEGILGGHTRALVARLRREGPRLTRELFAGPRCLLHGDLRLDNMFFTSTREVRALIDWQLANLGPAVLDVAYFLSGSVDADIDEDDVDELLVDYHRALVAGGVDDYPLGRLMADYERALLVNLHRVASLDSIEFGDGRGVALVDAWLHRLDRRLARVPV